MKSVIAVLLLSAVSVSAQTIAIPDSGIAYPEIAASRTRVLATWESQQQIRAELIDFGGQVIAGPFDLPLSGGAAIVTDGKRFLVYASDGINVEGAFIEADGSVGQPFTIVAGTTQAVGVFDGTRYLFFWVADSVIRGVGLSPEGVLQTPFDVASRPGAVSVTGAASHGHVTAVTWSQWIPGSVLRAEMAIVARNSTSQVVQLATMNPWGGLGTPFIADVLPAWNGTEWFVLWRSGRTGRADAYEGSRVTASGEVLDVNGPGDEYHAGGITIDSIGWAPEAGPPGLQVIGSQFLVTWTRSGPFTNMYVGRYVHEDGGFGAMISLSYGKADIEYAATDALPDGTLVSFVPPLFETAFIRFGRVARRRVSR